MAAPKAVRKNNRLTKPVSKPVEKENPYLTEEMKTMLAEQEIAQLKAELAAKDQIIAEEKKKKAGKPGWIVKTENPEYDGVTCGVKFKKGVAVIPGEDEALAKLICDDFGYTRIFAENIFDIQEVSDQVAGSMADILGGAAQV